jgi:hypothetical protein
MFCKRCASAEDLLQLLQQDSGDGERTDTQEESVDQTKASAMLL